MSYFFLCMYPKLVVYRLFQSRLPIHSLNMEAYCPKEKGKRPEILLKIQSNSSTIVNYFLFFLVHHFLPHRKYQT